MTLTHRHFVAVAEILATHRADCAGEDAFDDLVERFLNYLSTQNDLFDWGRFKAAVYDWEGA